MGEATDGIRFVKGHGTQNDFVLLPDLDGRGGPPDPDLVRALCERRAGLGADGVIRVVRTDATDDPHAVAAREEAPWFMDHYNSDGSTSEMCGNGVRVMAELLRVGGHLTEGESVPIASRDGIKVLTLGEDGQFTADMGHPQVGEETWVSVADRRWSATRVSTGNPHAVAFVDDLADAGRLYDEPGYDHAVYPNGVNIEFVVLRGPRHVAMRVHERASGETRSCGTGACAVLVASAVADGLGPGTAYDVDVPGGRLRVQWTVEDRLLLTGPAVLVAEGYWLAGR